MVDASWGDIFKILAFMFGLVIIIKLLIGIGGDDGEENDE